MAGNSSHSPAICRAADEERRRQGRRGEFALQLLALRPLGRSTPGRSWLNLRPDRSETRARLQEQGHHLLGVDLSTQSFKWFAHCLWEWWATGRHHVPVGDGDISPVLRAALIRFERRTSNSKLNAVTDWWSTVAGASGCGRVVGGVLPRSRSNVAQKVSWV